MHAWILSSDLFFVGSCTEIVCPTLRNPVNGAVFFTHSCFGGGALYTCNLGFRQPTGLLKRTCRENSQWDGEEPSCDRKSLCMHTYSILSNF